MRHGRRSRNEVGPSFLRRDKNPVGEGVGAAGASCNAVVVARATFTGDPPASALRHTVDLAGRSVGPNEPCR